MNQNPPPYSQNLLIQPVPQCDGQQFYPAGGATPVVYAYQTRPTTVVYDNYRSCQSKFTGVAQIIIGICLIAFNATVIGLKPNGIGPVSHGFWGGLLFIVTGSFGIGAGKWKSKCPVITYMVLCIVSACITAAVFSVGVVGIVLRTEDCYYYWYQYCGNNPDAVVAMHAVIMVLGIVEAVFAIWGSVICCKAACCCTSNMVVSPVQFSTNHGTTMIILGTPYPVAGYPVAEGPIVAPIPYESAANTMPPSADMSEQKRPLDSMP